MYKRHEAFMLLFIETNFNFNYNVSIEGFKAISYGFVHHCIDKLIHIDLVAKLIISKKIMLTDILDKNMVILKIIKLLKDDFLIKELEIILESYTSNYKEVRFRKISELIPSKILNQKKLAGLLLNHKIKVDTDGSVRTLKDETINIDKILIYIIRNKVKIGPYIYNSTNEEIMQVWSDDISTKYSVVEQGTSVDIDLDLTDIFIFRTETPSGLDGVDDNVRNVYRTNDKRKND